MLRMMSKKCLNVRQKLGTRNVLKNSHSFTFTTFATFTTFSTFTLSFTHSPHAEQLMFSCLCSKVTLSHSRTLSFTLSRHAERLLFSCLGSKVTLSLSHTLTLSHSRSLSISHSLTLDMLNNFCFHVYAQKSLFIGENDNDFFGNIHNIRACDIKVHRAGSQLKIISI